MFHVTPILASAHSAHFTKGSLLRPTGGVSFQTSFISGQELPATTQRLLPWT
jgi:hypothetical protein